MATAGRKVRFKQGLGVATNFLVFLLCLRTSESIHFDGNPSQYAIFPKWNACVNASLFFEFRSTGTKIGLLAYADDGGKYDFMQLSLDNGKVNLTLNIVDGRDGRVEIVAGENLDDNRWHKVTIGRKRMETTLTVDGVSESKVAIGSDFHFGNIETNSPLYIGGLPVSFVQPSELKRLSLPSAAFLQGRFRGEIRNVLYGNCTCQQVRADVQSSVAVTREPQEACEVDNPCGPGCLCISTDEGPGCDCSPLRCEPGAITYYHLPMNFLVGDTALNPSGLDATANGEPRLVRGVSQNALAIEGRRQWLRVTGPGHRYECFGDLDKCPNGYTLMLWVQFTGVAESRGVYLSNGGHSDSSHGIAMFYGKGVLEFVFKRASGEQWSVEYDNILTGHWYHVTVTWSRRDGLVLYINGDLEGQDSAAARKAPARTNSRYNDFIIGRANDYSGLGNLGTIVVDEFQFWSTFKSSKEVRELGPIYKYYLSMDQAGGGNLVTKNLRGKLEGNVNQVEGKSGMAISLSGGGDYVDFGPQSDICLGNMEKCLYGFYTSMWIKFNKLDSNTYFVATGPKGVNIFYQGGRLYAELTSDEKLWRTYWYRPVIGRWYFLEISWDSKNSFSMYIDLELEAVQREYSYHRPRETSHQNFYIGRANTPMNAEKFAAIDVDEFESFYADRDTLIFIGFIQRGKPTNHYFDFDRMSGSRIVHPAYVINTFGNPKLVSGKIRRALSLNGNSQVADIGEHADMCLGNLDYCPHGAMQAFWLRPGDMVNNMHYMSNGLNGFSLMYSRGRLHVSATTSTREWKVSVPMVMAHRWHFIELSWHPERGLQLFSDQKLIGETDRGVGRTVSQRDAYNPQMNHFYIGRGNTDMRSAEFANATVDELEYWYSTREYLLAHDLIQRGEPMNYLISMEEIRNNRLVHPTLTLPVVGKPAIVTGQVGNALRLNGRGQYVDMGEQTGKCLGNLQLCNHGITIGFWVNFQNFENNMYYLSTGGNGIQIFHRDGHVFFTVNQPGKTWQAAIRRADWLRAAKWYFVELSWHPEHGLNVYIDNKLAESVRDPTLRETSSADGNVYIGRANLGDTSGRFVYADAIFDEMEIWYGRREVLLAFDYILRELIGYETFSMESASNGIVEHPKFTVTLVNGGRIVDGMVGNAAELNGNRQYIDLGEHGSRCMGNLEHCKHGLTISLYLKTRDLQDDVYFLSSPSYSLYYKNGRLHSTFNTRSQSWTTATNKFRKNVWELVEMSWHKDKGIVLRLNGEEVGKSDRPTTVQNDEPSSNPVYVGKSISSKPQEKYANVLVDEVEYHYSSIDNLDARGITNRDPIRHEVFHTGGISNGLLEHPNRRVVVYGNPDVVAGKIGRAVYLNGRSQYIDLGDDVPCQGSLDRCPRGFTLRFDVKPLRLSNNQYFVGSHPVSVYYKDGRIYTTVRTEERTYTTSSSGFDKDKWQRVEVSYAPEVGLQLYLNGVLASSTNRYTRTPISYDVSRKTYLGRTTTDMVRERYADAIIEDVEFWDARRDYLSDYPDFPEFPKTTLPGVSGGPPVTTPRPGDDLITNEMKKVVYFDGGSNIVYDFTKIDSRFFRDVPNEELRFLLATYNRDGLIWFTDNPDRSMHISMKDGRLVFYLEYGSGGLVQTVTFPQRLRLNDGRYHYIQVKRQGRQLTFLVDGREVRSITLPRDLEFLAPGEVLIGGAPNTADVTGDIVSENFNGYLGDFEYRKRDRRVKIDVELFALVRQGGDVTIEDVSGAPPTPRPIVTRPTLPTLPTLPTTPRPPRQTAITFKLAGSYLRLPSWEVGQGSTISFDFRTIEPKGLLLFNGGDSQDGRFFAVELYDGKLYLVFDFGGITTRHEFSSKIVNDGDFHNVRMNVQDRFIVLSLDGSRKTINLPKRTVGKFTLRGPLFVGFVDRGERIPWYVWSRHGYRGCLRNLRVNDELSDLHQIVRDQFPLSVELRCVVPAQHCVHSLPCWSGTCHERWEGYYCDCSATAYRGRNCDKVAPVATLDGHTPINVRFPKTKTTHTDDLSLQFRTPLANALLFETKARGNNRHVKVYLENGRVKFETNIGGEKKVMRVGSNLNDNNWHTLHIRRRADYIEMWVDSDEHKSDKIPGEGFFLHVDEILLGTKGDGTGEKHKFGFIGHLRNFRVDDVFVLSELDKDSIAIPPNINDLPPILFYPVTFRTRDAYATLPSLAARDTMNLSFMFKTTASSGLILYNAGRGKKFMGVELNYGQLNYVLSDGVTTYLARVGEPYSLNDNKWHNVLIQRLDTGEHIVSVDGKSGKVSAPDEPWDFTERFFIGGLPDRKFEDEKVKLSFSSRKGFQGCIASLNLNGYVPDFYKEATFDKSLVSQGCLDPSIMCGPTSCSNYGICVQEFAGYWCNCNMTSYVGTACTEYGVGYRLNKDNKDGVIVYNFPAGLHPDTNSDELAFGFKTYQENGLLARVDSSIVDDFIEVRLENGHVVVVYDTGDKEHKLIESSQQYNDGKYHVVRFYRNRNNATLFVDNYPGQVVDNTGQGYVFNRQAYIYLGADRSSSGLISNKFNGIIAGFHFNGIRALDLVRIGGSHVRTYENVIFVPPPLLLDRSIIITAAPILKPRTTLPPIIGPVVTPPVKVGPPVDPPIIVPADVGGVGVAWSGVQAPPGASGGGGGAAGGLVVGVHPLGTGGTGGLSGGPVAGALATAGGPGAAGIFSGVRAGAVLGTVLGILAFLSSLMWAFYRCKPGWCPCWAPAGSPATPLDISAPRAGSNLAVVQAQSGGAFMGGGKTSTVNGGAASSGGQYASYYGTSNAQAGSGRAMSTSESYDSATLRATGTFSNKGTVIGTPKAQRREVDGLAGGSYSSSTFRQASSSFSGGQQLSPPPPQYNTIGGSYGNSTMSSSYQYQVQNVRTVSMGQHSFANAGLPAGAITLQGPAAEEIRVDCCLITSDGRNVITGSYIGTPHVWDMSNGELVRFMKGNTNGSTDLHLACNDRLLVGDVNTDVDVNEFSNRKGVMNRKLQIWDFQSGRPLEMGGDEYCSALCIMSDGDKVVYGRTNQMGTSTSVVVWDLLGNQMIKEMRYDASLGNNDHVCFLALSQNDRYVVAGFRNTIDGQANYVVFDMTLTSYNIVEPSLLMLDAEPEVTVTLPRDEAVTGLRNGDLVIWNLRNGRSSRQLLSNSGHHAHSREVKALALSEDNRFLVSASADGTLKLWDMATEKQAYTMTGHGDEVWCCAISCDNEIIVSGSRDGTIRLWRLKTGTQMCVFNAQLDIFSVKMSRDKGTIVALADKFGTRKLIMLQVVRTKSTRKYSL